MTGSSRTAITSLVVAFVAVSSAGADQGVPGRRTAWELGLRPVGTYVQFEAPQRPRPMFAEETPTILFLNRNGGSYRTGWQDDSVTNESSILSWDVDMPPYPYGDESWNQFMECMRNLYVDFNVIVTDEDPGDTPHGEVVVSGHPSDIGLSEGIGGIAPMMCQPVFNAISYAFPETYGDYPQGICDAAGQESAHAFGLDHEYLCEDVMTYLFDCAGPKRFVDEDAPCGEFSERACSCGGNTQNSYQFLLDALGPADTNVPPSVIIVGPEEGDEVDAGFTVSATASDEDGTIDHLELWIDAQPIASRQSEPWELDAPDDIAEGDHEVEVLAFDDSGASASAVVLVAVSAEARRDGARRSRGGCSASGGTANGGTVLGLAAMLLAAGLGRVRRSAR